ncbi:MULTISPECIES: NtaA/DmoA family FMN-dependent monooxygenase [Rhodococcus]|uniref:NtaA/DmoA family FMN-dependent monooxygenase n=1 Tax=Rhodococcus rhodochrous TaxID=1829 RepID=A0AA46WZR0_RHORH|nr:MULTISPECIES: NtaA/DmoA family FMN-dependent monooxygenase [Rhodococcus]MBH0121008.1 NtaA/DmoA family FMN-dependent monooxygenase [Rhodococcus sp. CX]UZF46649.1 NtaA/DmoA family FMN-dependent monooxygenase [Rhodococcus rhodochrous]
MTADPFRLGWFGNLAAPEWKSPYSGIDATTNYFNGRFYVDMVRNLERAGFDFLMIEDSLMVSDIYRGTAEIELKHARYAPKMDPVVTASMLAAATEHIGIIATASTTFYHPYQLARQFATLNNLTGGRVGWNIVTSSEDLAAQNYGLDKLPEHDLRYEMAEEFVDVAMKLWGSWEDGAILADPESGYYADYKKVHPIHHEGRFYKSRGPLNVPPGPGGRPVFCQAGGSPRGRDFAAKYADVILTIPHGVEGAKEYRADIRARAAKFGRNPDDIKVFSVVYPIVGETEQEAKEKNAAWYARKEHNFEVQMAHFAATMEIDFSQFDPDQPIPDDVSTNGHQSQLEVWRKQLGGRTIREGFSGMRVQTTEMVGTPDSIAAQMDEFMQEVGGDGFLIYGQPISRQSIAEMTDGVAPALQRRGLLRTDYAHSTLRENLRSFV